jgi:hypothetical protein
MRLIGESIQEAIDWTQDTLATTRPLAEGTLFTLLKEHAVRETADGFVLMEKDEEETRTVRKAHNRAGQRNRRRVFRNPRRHRQTAKADARQDRVNVDMGDDGMGRGKKKKPDDAIP